jgi:valyl-tRNA synthetase
MDDGCSKAVREAFCEMYDKGLIYKGSRIINWCPHCTTALSDAEVEYVEKPGSPVVYPLSHVGRLRRSCRRHHPA